MRTIRRGNWTPVTAGHLLTRAGFAALPAVVDACLAHSPEYVVDAMLRFAVAPVENSPPVWFGPDAVYRVDPSVQGLPREERQRANNRLQAERMEALRHWWCVRMLESPYPLQEKLTLFWHGHFATSNAKVRSPYALYKQNELFRAHAAGSWRSFLRAITRDPAMMVYLDTSQSRMQNPNENYARELMELFTLGEGRYTEEDIREAARAFTGLRLEAERYDFVFRPNQHDSGHKRFMGRGGRFGADEILDIILEHPEAASFIVRKLATFFMGVEPDALLVERLARRLRAADWELVPMLRLLFLSEDFYEPAVRRNQIKSPVQWLIGTCQLLERPLPPDPLPRLMLQELGQDLFAPPNVKGWDGGYAWISTTTLMRRTEFADILINGSGAQGMRGNWRRHASGGFVPAATENILPEAVRSSSAAAIAHLEQRFFHTPTEHRDKVLIKRVVEGIGGVPAEWTDAEIREAALLCARMAQFQVT